MITFVNKPSSDTVNIKLIATDLTKMMSAINGFDICNIDHIIQQCREDNSIQHVNVLVNYYKDENELLEFINKYKNSESNNTVVSFNVDNNKMDNDYHNKKEDKKTSSKKHDIHISSDFICPECGENDCLIDKNGNKYPCLSCLQIDIGQKIMKNYSKIVDRNNALIQKLCEIFTVKKEND